jgi:hypothetical protein
MVYYFSFLLFQFTHDLLTSKERQREYWLRCDDRFASMGNILRVVSNYSMGDH